VTRILIADDHAIVRDGLRRILHSAPGIEIVVYVYSENSTSHSIIVSINGSCASFAAIAPSTMLDRSTPDRPN
jgi:hypothetical protein